MKKYWPKLVTFFVVLLAYFLPSIIFPMDTEFYKSLNGPKLPPWVFAVAWLIIYITMSIFVTIFIFYSKEHKNNETKRITIFLIINYLIQATFLPVFFLAKNLFLAYVVTLFTFITALIVALESLLVNKKLTILTLPYLLWSAFASIISILVYLQN